MKKTAVFLIGILFALLMFSGIAFADEELSEESVTEADVIVVDSEEVENNDELLMEYIEFSMSTSNAPMYSTFGLRNLSGINVKVYGLIKTCAAKVAKGELTSTVFSFSPSDLGVDGKYSASDLGVEAVVSNGSITTEGKAALQAILQDIDLNRINTALLYDCPEEFYWYEKTVGCHMSTSFGIGASYDDALGEYVLYFSDTTQISFSYTVAEDYAVNHEAGTYEVDSDVIVSIQTAIEHANEIITSHTNESDYQKLASYKEEICAAVSYNTEAGNHNYTYNYGNPWQLIWAFDEDDTTNVVCEGYSKAFQFLCDGTAFNSEKIQSRLVTGNMSGGTGAGGHMWNVVTMDDGLNYLVDVTNCDSGTIGYPDELFLVGTSNEYDETKGYTIQTGSGYSISYLYDDDTCNTYISNGDDSLLVLAAENYDYNSSGEHTVHTYGDWKVTKAATCTEAGSREKTCSVCGDKVTETIAALGHSWNDTYTIDKEATCTDPGSKSIHCSVCGAVKDGSTQTIEATGHSYGDWKVTKAATCTEAGSREKTCSVCGDKVTETIAALGHSLTQHVAVAADYEKAGNSEYWSCSNCGKYFSDAAAKNEIEENSWVIPKKERKFGHYTGLVNDNGTLIYLTDGTPDTTYSGIVQLKDSADWYYVKDGYVNTSYNGVEPNEYGWWKIENGIVNFKFHGLAANEYGTWYLKDGKVDFNYTGFAAGTANGESGWWYVEKGQVKFNKTDILSGTANTAANKAGVSGWWYIINSKVYAGDTVAKNSYGWWAIRGGKVDFNYTGFAKNAYGWWYAESGQVTFKKNDILGGIANADPNADGVDGWWYVKGSQVTKKTTVANNAYGWWFVKDGQVDFTYNGVESNDYGWWCIHNGKVDFGYIGFEKNAYGWWYIEKGQVTFKKNDVISGKANTDPTAEGEDGWWYIVKSQVTKKTNVAQNAYGWWYVKDGKVDFTYTGLAENAYGMWYIENGQVDFDHSKLLYKDSNGVWQEGFILNTKSGVFHDYTCGHVKEMSAKNKGYMKNSYSELVAKGYRPCNGTSER